MVVVDNREFSSAREACKWYGISHKCLKALQQSQRPKPRTLLGLVRLGAARFHTNGRGMIYAKAPGYGGRVAIKLRKTKG